jgi:integrase
MGQPTYLFGGNGRRYDSEHFAFAPSAKPYDHSRFYRQVFLPTVRGLGIPVRFHDLRHYHASAVLEAGLPVPYVAKRLGHANAQMILTVYGHVPRGSGRRAG